VRGSAAAMGDGFRVRVAVEGDLAAVVGLERGMATAPHWSEREYRAAVRGGAEGLRRRVFVAEGASGVVGFAVGKVVVEGEIESVAVAEAAWRRGVGRALCAAVVAWCGEMGVAAVELEVRSGSAGAIALYIEMGFVEIGRRRGYYREPVEDAVLMVKTGIRDQGPGIRDGGVYRVL
jgi:ribosomal-protein-alanine N-acetyltransferase